MPITGFGVLLDPTSDETAPQQPIEPSESNEHVATSCEASAIGLTHAPASQGPAQPGPQAKVSVAASELGGLELPSVAGEGEPIAESLDSGETSGVEESWATGVGMAPDELQAASSAVSTAVGGPGHAT
jgi:hypothetical protein